MTRRPGIEKKKEKKTKKRACRDNCRVSSRHATRSIGNRRPPIADRRERVGGEDGGRGGSARVHRARRVAAINYCPRSGEQFTVRVDARVPRSSPSSSPSPSGRLSSTGIIARFRYRRPADDQPPPPPPCHVPFISPLARGEQCTPPLRLLLSSPSSRAISPRREEGRGRGEVAEVEWARGSSTRENEKTPVSFRVGILTHAPARPRPPRLCAWA